jgi:outer membrane receptor for ferric coprogen and ferric-rhodotorulic acid
VKHVAAAGVELAPELAIWRVGGGLLELGVRNLFDRTYPEVRADGFVSPGQPRSVDGTVRYIF